jgi:hypothetical protein
MLALSFNIARRDVVNTYKIGEHTVYIWKHKNKIKLLFDFPPDVNIRRGEIPTEVFKAMREAYFAGLPPTEV